MINSNIIRHKTTDENSRSRLNAEIDRRKFFKIFGSGLAVAVLLPDITSLAGTSVISPENETLPVTQVGAWIHIIEDGTVNVFTGKVEVGQNIRTSLSQVVAEELSVNIHSVRMIMADTDLVPFDMGTFGSRSTPQMGSQLRKASLTAKQALLNMAALKWNTSAELLTATDGYVCDSKSASRISYADLTKGERMLIKIADDLPAASISKWKVLGKNIPKIDGPFYISGVHKYVSDMKCPGMLYGKILRPPSLNATLVSADLSKAKAMAGVFVMQEDNFVGVAAPDPETAEEAIRSIAASWKETKQANRQEIFEFLPKHSDGQRQRGAKATGDIDKALASAIIRHKSRHHINYIAHVPLEPRAALAEWTNGRLTVYTGTQRPFGVQEDLAETFKVPKEKVRVITPDTGSGYGGKHSAEAAEEASRLSLAAGKPVKLVWTRKEEFAWAYFRPAGVIEINSGVSSAGSISAWKADNYNSGPAGLDIQYKADSKQVAHHPCESPWPQGSYRGLASTANVFARESHIADLARLAKKDQLEFRLANLNDDRLKAALAAAAKAFNWSGRKAGEGRGCGLACGFEKGGYVGTCAEVMVGKNKTVKILRIVQAFECGAIINPRHLESQVVGSIVQGLGGALFEAIDFADGKVLNGSLSQYRVPRFKDIPPIEIVLLNRQDLPSAGAGEAAIIGIAPAIRNAILDACGVALNHLPLIPKGVVEVG